MQQQPSKEQPVKKPYHRPELTVYGPLRELTQGGPTGLHMDGGTIFGRNKS